MHNKNMMPGSNTDKLIVAVKASLMRAWRERANEATWGLYLKQALHSQNMSNAINDYSLGILTDSILQQAIASSTPSLLIFTYLKHMVATQIVPASTILSCAIKHIDFSKHVITQALLELVDFVITSVSHNVERSSELPNVLYRVVTCILKSLIHYLSTGSDTKHLREYIPVMEMACSVLAHMSESATFSSLVYLSLVEDTDSYRTLEQHVSKVRTLCSQLKPGVITQACQDSLTGSLSLLDKLSVLPADVRPILDMSLLPLFSSINILVTLEAILNPINNTDLLIDQLLLIQSTMNVSVPRLCSEVLRACLMGLVDSRNTSKDSTWAAFTFLKVPDMLVSLSRRLPNFNLHLEHGFEKLIQYSALLDLVDTRWSCDSMEVIMGECKKLNLLSDSFVQKMLKQRSADSKAPAGETTTSQTSASLIIRAPSTLSSILKTLDEHYANSMDGLLSILSLMLKSFDLLLVAAAAVGQVPNLTRKLIKFNEIAKHSTAETPKYAQTRLLVFDISFVMLCNIIQLYGIEILDSISAECSSSFFMVWALRYLPDSYEFKCLDDAMPSDRSGIDHMITQVAEGTELKLTPQLEKLDEVCLNVPFVVYELLIAWEHGAIDVNPIKTTIEAFRGHMCSFSIAIAAHLSSYLNTTSHSIIEKPRLILDFLMTDFEVDSYKERLPVLMSILRRMTKNIPCNSGLSEGPSYMKPTVFPVDVLTSCMKDIFTLSWLNEKCLDTMKHLLNLCGSSWLCSQLMELLLKSETSEMLSIVGVLFALFHMDLEQMTLNLIRSVLPELLQSSRSLAIHQVHCDGLAKLSALSIAATHTCYTHQSTADVLAYTRRGRKRSFSHLNPKKPEHSDEKKQKGAMMEEVSLLSEGFSIDMLNVKESAENNTVQKSSTPLSAALDELFTLFSLVRTVAPTTPRSHFITSFIREAINCNQSIAKFILHPLQNEKVVESLLPQLYCFSNAELMRIFDLSSPHMRKLCAKVICQKSAKSLTL